MKAFGATAHEVDIRPACEQMFRDIAHPFARGERVYDVTFENVQAGARTSPLFRAANQHDALVIGTSDLSELALGWCTYGVGDQMSHYAVNVSVPKTLIQHLIRWAAKSREEFEESTRVTLKSILETEISPELVPALTADSTSPPEILGRHRADRSARFSFVHITRHGLRPSKVAFLAHHAWGDRARGEWPDSLPAYDRHEYDLPAIKHWLGIFLRRFFQLSQFKRSAIPNGPKVGSGGSRRATPRRMCGCAS